MRNDSMSRGWTLLEVDDVDNAYGEFKNFCEVFGLEDNRPLHKIFSSFWDKNDENILIQDWHSTDNKLKSWLLNCVGLN